MEQEIKQLKLKIEELETKLMTSNYNMSIDIYNILGMAEVVSTTTSAITTSVPTSLYEQIKIFNDGSTKKLYVYDYYNKAWLSVTIA